MSQSAPGKHYREGMNLTALFRKFPNDRFAAAEKWFIETRWPSKAVAS